MATQQEYAITLQINNDILAVCRLSPNKQIPIWISLNTDKFISITQTSNELTIVCDQSLVPNDVKAEKNWRILRIKGQLDFALVGILKRVISPLAENEISIYAISTYDTDYILIQEDQFEKALGVLQDNFTVEAY